MGNLITYRGEILATYYIERKGRLEGYTFEFEGLEALTKLLSAPDTDSTDEGDTINEVKSKLGADDCFGIFLSYKQRYLNQCKS